MASAVVETETDHTLRLALAGDWVLGGIAPPHSVVAELETPPLPRTLTFDARLVGREATTSAVVSGIVSIVMATGVITYGAYVLGI